MEENKNKAIEKVENIANGVENSTATQPLTEEQKAQIRVEQAVKKEREKAELQKEKTQKEREKNKIKQDKLAQKQADKKAREEKKQMLKEKTAEERRNLKHLERQAKIEAKQNKRKEKTRIKMEKLSAKRGLKEQKEKNKQKRKDSRRGYGGWLAAVICLGISTIALATALTLTYLIPQEADLAMESVYSKSFYDTVEQVDNIDLNLSKVLASNDEGAIQTYLLDIAVESELCESDLGQLPLQDENKFYTTKLINQIGDYAKYLNKKIISGDGISQEDRENLLALYNANLNFKENLQAMVREMGSDFSFSTLNKAGNGNLIVKSFNELQNLSVEFPELIYDGPFSDGLNRKEIKGLTGKEINGAVAMDRFNEIFGDMGVSGVKQVGETSALIETFNVEGMINGESLYAQISKKGGELIMFDYQGSCKEVNYQRDDAIETATEFLEKLGVYNMKAVWSNLSNNLYTINFAYEQDGIIVYSDLIKVRVCAETNKVIGLEASSYYTNHTKRVTQQAGLSKDSASKKLSQDIEVESARLCIVPIGTSGEKLCYEFMGMFNDSVYYVYIDAITGRQVEMFKVIESTEGQLLM